MTGVLVSLDRLVLGLFQRVVDEFQQSPSWWARQCLVLCALTAPMIYVLRPSSDAMHAVATVVIMAIYLFFYDGLGRDAWRARIVGGCWWRLLTGLIVLPALCWDLYRWAVGLEIGALDLALNVNGLAWLSVFYFGACRPPPPPRRVPKPALHGGGA
jgi:hypothetical protein